MLRTVLYNYTVSRHFNYFNRFKDWVLSSHVEATVEAQLEISVTPVVEMGIQLLQEKLKF